MSEPARDAQPVLNAIRSPIHSGNTIALMSRTIRSDLLSSGDQSYADSGATLRCRTGQALSLHRLTSLAVCVYDDSYQLRADDALPGSHPRTVSSVFADRAPRRLHERF